MKNLLLLLSLFTFSLFYNTHIYSQPSSLIIAFDADVSVGGYTQMGAEEDHPWIRVKKITGTTSVSNASQNFTHGLPDHSKILGVHILAEFIFDGPNWKSLGDYTITAGHIEVFIPGLVGSGRPIKMLVIYEN